MPTSAALLEGKKGLVLGVANDRSIAWGIAKAAHENGARMAFTYQGDALLKRIKPLIDTLGEGNVLMPCDVTSDADMDAVFASLKEQWGTIDFVVHAVAFSDKEQLKGHYKDTTRDNFRQTMDISVFSFTDVARRASAIMNDGGSMITLTYYGAERVMPHYNVMGVAKAALEASVRYLAADLGERGIRVNAISAGPIKTLAAMGIGDFRHILKWNEFNSPLQRNVSIDDVGGSGLYLLSDLSKGVTGEVHHVDSGYHTVGMLNMNSVAEVADLLASIKKE
ncbi:enoyl-ACP reductase FabI [Pararhodospirillum oryzae]|uniref:Enoyl-[acyl-carrier-protein] reductase [NADH] n=1 Tax=Pararhodospirillum oryzae TaxID=478448 RepID=A0A512H856_9PROT|nr:enoyl-ACP reductase FabI [Pararhodospirillum oryzae]GEO81608.1 enoyl-[acyl-carrier-protein] reductase [NADH] [Pararhodospirillum oryzae]